MRSIGSRVVLSYAVASLLTLGAFFALGRYLVERHVEHGLDLGIGAEHAILQRRLGPGLDTAGAAEIRRRLTSFAPVRFAIEIVRPDGEVVYSSSSLGGRPVPSAGLPDNAFASLVDRVFGPTHFGHEVATPALRFYNVVLDGEGETRVGEFSDPPLLVRIVTSKDQVRSLVEAYDDVFYGLLALSFLASVAIGFLVSRVFLRPLRLIQATARRIRSDNLGERIPVAGVKDELSDLARLLNDMFDRLEASFNQIRRFAAEASHELKTPLSLVRLQAERLLIEGELPPSLEEAVQMQLEEIARLNRIIEELLFLHRAEAQGITLQIETLDATAFLEAFAADARVLAEARDIAFVTDLRRGAPVRFDPHRIRQVLFNLVSNALNASPPGSTITLHSEFGPEVWRVALEDQGIGVPAAQRDRIFERFVRLGEEPDAGGGLGLAISRSIIQLHRGAIRADEATEGPGLRVVFELPGVAAEPAASCTLPASTGPGLARGRPFGQNA